MTHSSIVVLGSIASGKSTLMEVLSEGLSLPAFPEKTGANPFLASLGVDPQRCCFQNQTWFLTEAHATRLSMKGRGGVTDHSIEEVAIHNPLFHQRTWLSEDELSLLGRLSEQLLEGSPGPNLYVALSAPPETLISRVSQRARNQDVLPTVDYLVALSERRDRFLATTKMPLVSIDSEVTDFRSGHARQVVCQTVLNALEQG